MEIKLEDHLTECEMKNIAAEAFRDSCLQLFKDDHERILGNVAHKIVWDEVDKVMDGNLQSVLVAKVKEVVTKMSEFSIFRQKNVWEKEDSVGQQMLNEAVRSQKTRIENKVVKVAEELTKEDVLELLADSDLFFKLTKG